MRIPPLRERTEDLPLLVEALLDEVSVAMGKRVKSISPASLDAIQRYAWPGNVRELRNVIERAIILAKGPVLEVEIPGTSQQAAPSQWQPAGGSVGREGLLRVLEQTGWRIRGTNGAAERLGLKATTLEARMVRLGIRRP